MPRVYRIWLPIHQMRRASNPLRLPHSPAVIARNIEHHSRPRRRVDIDPTDPSGICATEGICPHRLIWINIRRFTIVNSQNALAPSALALPRLGQLSLGLGTLWNKTRTVGLGIHIVQIVNHLYRRSKKRIPISTLHNTVVLPVPLPRETNRIAAVNILWRIGGTRLAPQKTQTAKLNTRSENAAYQWRNRRMVNQAIQRLCPVHQLRRPATHCYMTRTRSRLPFLRVRGHIGINPIVNRRHLLR